MLMVEHITEVRLQTIERYKSIVCGSVAYAEFLKEGGQEIQKIWE